jgi:UPF0755 protein
MPKLIFSLRFLGFVFLITLLISLLFSIWFYRLVTTPVILPATPYEFSIERGNGLRNIAQQLADTDILPNAWSFILLSYITGYNASIKAGEYALTQNLSPLDLLKYLTQGKVKQHAVTFLEGWTFS